MKALTLHQPWASLIAGGVKRIETRGWKTNHRGPLAIHASSSLKSVPREGLRLEGGIEVWRAGPSPDLVMARPGDRWGTVIPRGAVVATCELAGCVRVVAAEDHLKALERRAGGQWIYRGPHGELSLVTSVVDRDRGPVVNEYSIDNEDPFGDFTTGRYGWLLKDVVPLDAPALVAGAQGLWDLDDRLVA